MDTVTENVVEKKVTIEDVNRVLDVGRLLFSVLNPEEIEELKKQFSSLQKLGNTGDS